VGCQGFRWAHVSRFQASPICARLPPVATALGSTTAPRFVVCVDDSTQVRANFSEFRNTTSAASVRLSVYLSAPSLAPVLLLMFSNVP
jgi:hypothetical protein